MKQTNQYRAAFRHVFLAVIVCLFGHTTAFGLEHLDIIAQSRSIAHYAMGVMYDMRGLTAFALHEYEQSVKYDDGVALSRLRLGSNYARVGRLDEAAQHLSTASALNPDDLQARYLLALIYSTERKFDQAANEYESILKSFSASDPQNVEIYVYLGQLYYAQKQYVKAIEQFEHILSIDAENTEIIYVLSSLYLEVNQRDKAITMLKDCLVINPEHSGCLNSLAYTFSEDNIHLDEALVYINKALAIEPNNGAYLDTLGWIYYRRGELVEALQVLNQASELIEDVVVYEHIGDVYLAMDRADEAKKYWSRALDLYPDNKKIIDKINNLQFPSAKNQE